MEDLLISTLEKLGYPVLLQGSMLPDETYPDTFFTYWNDDTTDDGFYDNVENSVIWEFQLNVYSNNPLTVNTLLLDAKRELKAVGFIVDGVGHSVASDEQSHTGRGIDLIFKQEV